MYIVTRSVNVSTLFNTYIYFTNISLGHYDDCTMRIFYIKYIFFTFLEFRDKSRTITTNENIYLMVPLK